MSLFGSSPDDAGPQAHSEQKSSLFDDEQQSGAKTGSSLFDDDGGNGDSPWGMPIPKKAGRSNVIQNLLPTSAVPESYIDAFDALGESGYKDNGGRIVTSGVQKLFEGSGLGTTEQNRILKLVSGEREVGLGRNEFNVLLALMGLSQEREEASLDSVDERRRSKAPLAFWALV